MLRRRCVILLRQEHFGGLEWWKTGMVILLRRKHFAGRGKKLVTVGYYRLPPVTMGH